MSSLTTHFARRGLELAHGAVAGNDDQKIKLSPIAILVLFVTCLGFFVLIAAVSTHLSRRASTLSSCSLTLTRPHAALYKS